MHMWLFIFKHTCWFRWLYFTVVFKLQNVSLILKFDSDCAVEIFGSGHKFYITLCFNYTEHSQNIACEVPKVGVGVSK